MIRHQILEGELKQSTDTQFGAAVAFTSFGEGFDCARFHLKPTRADSDEALIAFDGGFWAPAQARRHLQEIPHLPRNAHQGHLPLFIATRLQYL
jgi:hypothetical protein